MNLKGIGEVLHKFAGCRVNISVEINQKLETVIVKIDISFVLP